MLSEGAVALNLHDGVGELRARGCAALGCGRAPRVLALHRVLSDKRPSRSNNDTCHSPTISTSCRSAPTSVPERFVGSSVELTYSDA